MQVEVVDEPTPPERPYCSATGETVEFRATHDYRTDFRWRYSSGAACTHAVVR